MALPGSPLINPRIQFFDNNGEPLAAGKLYSYLAGSSTETPLYTDEDLDPIHAASNPVILDSAGRPATNLYMAPLGLKLILKTSADVTVWTADEISDPPYVVFDTLANVSAEGSRDVTDGYVIDEATDNTVTVLPDATPDPCTVVLPAAADRGFPLTIINLSTSVDVAVSPAGSDTINGQSGDLTLAFGASPVFSGVTLNSDGISNWLMSAYW